MTNAQEIIDRALFPMRDTGATAYFDPDELLGFVNDAQADLSARERLFRSYATVTVQSDAEGAYFELPPQAIAPRWIKDPHGIEVGQLDESTFNEYKNVIPEDAETYIATYYSDRAFLWPMPVTGTQFSFGFYAVPAKLADPADDISLHQIWEAKLVRFVRAECYLRLGDVQQAAIDKQEYEKGLRPASAAVDRAVPGKINLAFEPGPFDLDLDSTIRGR